MKKFVLYSTLPLLFLVELFIIKGIPVLKETFPMDKIEATLFALTQNIDGSQDFTLSMIMRIFSKALVALGITALIVTAILLIAKYLRKKRLLTSKKFPTYLQLASCITLATFAYLIYQTFTQIPIISYYLALDDVDAVPEHSEFYQREYVNPDSVEIKFTKKQNLILIFLESMEYNYQDSANGGNLPVNLIPEITNYIQNEQSFIPGGFPAYGMGWTMADAVAKTCGIPLTFPPSISNSFTPLENFLPGVTCLTDILTREGYNFVVSKGANLKFSGMDNFLKTHSNPNAYGLLNYVKDPRVKENTISEWGVRDSLHYEIVKEHIQKLAELEKPWGLWMFTVDTHTPYGYLDPTCSKPDSIPESKQFPYVVSCASRQVDSFIKWAKKQEWFNNTTIAVMGDHASMAEPEVVGITEKNIIHYWLDFFINSAKKEPIRSRKFTSLDFFPTILESIGAEIPNGALGLGRSLYFKAPTLLEKYGKDSLNNALKKRSLEYNYFLYGNR